MTTRDYFAELFVAGLLADKGWNVYFPHRDKGFDFIISKERSQSLTVIRPVQVKGKYPTNAKTDKVMYGYIGKLNATHPDMVLCIPFFSHDGAQAPAVVAYMPLSQIRGHSRGFRCEPATFKKGKCAPRRDYKQFFDEEGLAFLESPQWGKAMTELP